MLVLGLHYDQTVVRIQAISDQQNIPKRFLEQILNDLKSGGFVQSKHVSNYTAAWFIPLPIFRPGVRGHAGVWRYLHAA